MNKPYSEKLLNELGDWEVDLCAIWSKSGWWRSKKTRTLWVKIQKIYIRESLKRDEKRLFPRYGINRR